VTARTFYEGQVAMGEDQVETAITTLQRQLLDAYGVPERRVLDLGCGAGANTLALFGSRPQAEVVGLDIAHPSAVAFRARTGRPVMVGSGEALPVATGSIDLVVCNDVIEHLVDPDRLMEEIRRVLAPGGHLVLSTPNLAAWFNRLALLAGVQPAFSEVSFRRIFGRPGADVVGHLRLYTPRALLPFLAYHGFTVRAARAAPFHAIPRPLRGLDRALSRSVSLGGITVVLATPTAQS
jgi:SAM-dependent methyltransferase